MKEETLIGIVRFGHQLKILRIYNCELSFSDELIVKLVDALKCFRQESDKPLQLLFYKANMVNLDAEKMKKFDRYLQIKPL